MQQIATNAPRRVITGFRNGRSVITEDGPVPGVSEHVPSLIMYDVWSTASMPVQLEQEPVFEDTLFPKVSANGSFFRYVQIPPDKALGITAVPGKPHPLMHQTNTLDYIIILSGGVYLVMEEEETLIRAGDIVIQRGTNHAWSNRTDKPCIQLAILLDAIPPQQNDQQQQC